MDDGTRAAARRAVKATGFTIETVRALHGTLRLSLADTCRAMKGLAPHDGCMLVLDPRGVVLHGENLGGFHGPGRGSDQSGNLAYRGVVADRHGLGAIAILDKGERNRAVLQQIVSQLCRYLCTQRSDDASVEATHHQ